LNTVSVNQGYTGCIYFQVWSKNISKLVCVFISYNIAFDWVSIVIIVSSLHQNWSLWCSFCGRWEIVKNSHLITLHACEEKIKELSLHEIAYFMHFIGFLEWRHYGTIRVNWASREQWTTWSKWINWGLWTSWISWWHRYSSRLQFVSLLVRINNDDNDNLYVTVTRSIRPYYYSTLHKLLTGGIRLSKHSCLTIHFLQFI